MGLQIAAMIVGLLLVSGASLWGLNGLQQDYGAALQGYAELRQIFEAGSHLVDLTQVGLGERPAARQLVSHRAITVNGNVPFPMASTVKIAPSILSADFSRLGEEIRAVLRPGLTDVEIQATAERLLSSAA